MKTLDICWDAGSPNAYLALQVLPGILDRTGATARYHPILLGGLFKLTNNQSPIFAFANVKGKLAYDMLEIRRFVARHGLSNFKMNPHFPINTLTLMRGATAVDEADADTYRHAVLAGMWERGLDMGQPEVLSEVMAEAGLDAAALLAATQAPDIKARLMARTQAAADRGAFGVPTFFIGEEMWFGKDRLAEVEAVLEA